MASTALAAALVADSDKSVLGASRVRDRAVPLSPSSIHNAPVPAPPLNDMAIFTFSSFTGCTVSARPPKVSSTLGRTAPEPADALALSSTTGSGWATLRGTSWPLSYHHPRRALVATVVV